MSFSSILQEIVDHCGGGIGAALMARDGVPIEEVMSTNDEVEVPFEEVGAAGIEFSSILNSTGAAAESLEGGKLDELVVSLECFTLVFRVIDEEIFLVVAISTDGNLGKLRYLIRRNLMALRSSL